MFLFTGHEKALKIETLHAQFLPDLGWNGVFVHQHRHGFAAEIRLRYVEVTTRLSIDRGAP